MALFSAVASSRRIFTTKARASQFTISRLRSKCPISKFIHITSVQRRNSGRPRVVRVHDLQQFPGTSGAKVATTHPPTSGLAAAAAAAATIPLFQLACREQAQQCSRLDIVKSEERERGGGGGGGSLFQMGTERRENGDRDEQRNRHNGQTSQRFFPRMHHPVNPTSTGSEV